MGMDVRCYTQCDTLPFKPGGASYQWVGCDRGKYGTMIKGSRLGSLLRIVKRVRLTVVCRTSREVRSYSIRAIAKKSRHLKLS